MSKETVVREYKMEELIPIVAKLTDQYTSGESSSITYERANQLMEAVMYCIDEVEGSSDCGRSLERKEGILSAEQAYNAGYQLVIEKTKRVKEQYNQMILSFYSYGNRAYYDTVVKGIPGFFLYYDPKFAPQNHLLTLDYPVLAPYFTQSGIDVMETYVNSICMEQEFLNKLPREYVTELLEMYHSDYKELLINVSAIVMRNLLGCMLADKPVSRKGFLVSELESVKEEVTSQSPQKLENELSHLLSVFLTTGYQKQKEELFSYFSNDIKDFAAELKNVAEHDALTSLLIR